MDYDIAIAKPHYSENLAVSPTSPDIAQTLDKQENIILKMDERVTMLIGKLSSILKDQAQPETSQGDVNFGSVINRKVESNSNLALDILARIDWLYETVDL